MPTTEPLWQPPPIAIERLWPRANDPIYTQAKAILADVNAHFVYDPVKGWGVREGPDLPRIHKLGTATNPPTCTCTSYQEAPLIRPRSLRDPAKITRHCAHTLAWAAYETLLSEVLSQGFVNLLPGYIFMTFAQGLSRPANALALFESSQWLHSHLSQRNHA